MEIKQTGYKPSIFSAEDMKNTSLKHFITDFVNTINESWKTNLAADEIAEIFFQIAQIKDSKCVLIVDEVENINPQYISDFLHAIRKTYHSRDKHCLKSVILVGVSNHSWCNTRQCQSV